MIEAKLIDCTVRDGGYINDWKFKKSSVERIIGAASDSGVDYAEIGYRYPDSMKGLGKFAYCSDSFLRRIVEKEKNCKIAVMMDVAKCEPSQFPNKKTSRSPIDLVRVAAYPREIRAAFTYAEKISASGYEVTINLVTAHKLEKKHFKTLGEWSGKKLLKALYFADSFGSLNPAETYKLVKTAIDLGYESVGFHSHNSRQMAFANAMAAVEAGAAFLDGSILGMGRGAGNAQIEALLAFYSLNKKSRRDPAPYFKLIELEFAKLRGKTAWGYGLKSAMCGTLGLHPYYADALIDEMGVSAEDAWRILRSIQKKAPLQYSKEFLEAAANDYFKNK